MRAILAAIVALTVTASAGQAGNYFRLFLYFSTPDQPSPHVQDGWGSMETKSLAECIKRRKHLTNYLNSQIKNPDVKFSAFCVEFHAHGFDEGMDAFKKRIGDQT